MSRFAACAALLSATLCQAADAPLFKLSVNAAPAETGKPLNMSFKEISRQADHSIAEIGFVSGSSVAASMFGLRGACGVARARNEKFFKVVPLSTNPTRVRLQFQLAAGERDLRPADIKEKIFSTAECTMFGY